MATIIKTKAGNFKAIIRVKQQVVKTRTFRLKKHAREWANRIEGDKDLIALYGSDVATVTFGQLADDYENWWSAKHNPKGLKARLGYWRNIFGDTRIIEIDSATIRKALRSYRETHAPATCNRLRSCLSSVFKYAITECGYLESNPVRLAPSLTEDNKIVRYLSDDERTALITACRQSECNKLYLLVLLALTTGARQGELLGLRWSDIDFNARTALLLHTKNGTARVITFPLPAMDELQRFRKVGTGLIFQSKKKWNRSFEFRRHWNKALDDAGIKNFRFHDLRHSAASYLAMSGATLKQIAEVLGHKSIQTTDRYAHLSVAHKQELTDKVLGNLGGLK